MEIKFNLETESFQCEHELISDVLNTLEYINKNKSGHFSSVAVLGYDYIIEKLFKVICQIRFEDSDAELSFNSLDYNFVDFENEYALILTLEDCYTREFTVSIEKALHEDGSYNLYDQDYLFIDEACSEELVKKHLQFEDTMDIFCINEDSDEDEEFDDEDFKCDGDCENCELNGEEEFDDEDDFDDVVVTEWHDLIEKIVENVLSEKFGLE